MFTVLVELFVAVSPVAAAFPPPNTEPLCAITLSPSVPIIVFPWTIILALPYTTAVAPFPPAYALPKIVAFFILTSVFPITVPSFPPPYILLLIFPPKISTFVLLFTEAWFPPPYIFWIFPVFINTVVFGTAAWFPPPYIFPIVPPLISIFGFCVTPPKLFPP